VDRRSGAAVRLLPERNDHPGRGSLEHDEESDEGPDQGGDERPPLPLRNPAADPQGDPAGRRSHGEGSEVMSELSRKTFLKGGGALIVGFSLGGAALGARAARGTSSVFGGAFPVIDLGQLDCWIAIHADN